MSRRVNKNRSRRAKQNYKRSALAALNAKRRQGAAGTKKRKLNKKQRAAILKLNLRKANAARKRKHGRRRRKK